MPRHYSHILIALLSTLPWASSSWAQEPINNTKFDTDTLYHVAYDNDTYHTIQPYEHHDTVWTNFNTGSRVHLIRLNQTTDTLVQLNRNGIKPVLEALAINFGVWGWDHFVTDRDWADINIHTIRRNLKHDFVLDHDSFSGNQFSHPFHGSMFYNAARYHGNSYYTAAAYPLIGSMVWEYFCETNLPSYNDFLSTGIGGTAIGEVTYRTSDIVFDNSKRGLSRVVREIVGSALNPARGIHRLFSGEMWHVSPSRGKMVDPMPFSVDVSLGNRYMSESRHAERSKNVSYVEFTLNYGDHFWHREKPAPFDFFQLHLLLNTSPHNPTFSDVDIRGRILSKQFMHDNGWDVDLGLYQNFRYVDNYGDKKNMEAGDYPLFCEAASFGLGTYLKKAGRWLSFSNDFSINGIGFGAVASDYYVARRYNFATGFSLRNNIRFAVNKVGCIGHDFYMARLYVPKGCPDPSVDGDYYWGDKGHTTIFNGRTYLQFRLVHSLRVNLEHSFFYRRSGYYYLKDVHAMSNEYKLGIIYSI